MVLIFLTLKRMVRKVNLGRIWTQNWKIDKMLLSIIMFASNSANLPFYLLDKIMSFSKIFADDTRFYSMNASCIHHKRSLWCSSHVCYIQMFQNSTWISLAWFLWLNAVSDANHFTRCIKYFYVALANYIFVFWKK